MSRFMRTLSFRRKKDRVPESSKPHQWQEDERKVREGTCSFQVRYLGCIEVFESRGMQVCEEAVKALKAKKHRSVWSRMSLRSRKKLEQNKGKYQRAILYVSGDALRVVDEISKGLIVDQTIEKVSFCAPDRNHEKGFAYICRDGTTRRWMCHAFLAVKESGERLSHAVGCAFAICLEKKQKREKEAVQVQFNDKGTSFSRTGSFRQTTITERLADPQSAMIAMPVPVRKTDITHAVERPHATPDMLIRQGSFRGFTKLSETSPFKRQLSLRLNELPSTLDRQRIVSDGGASNGPVITAAIPEVSPTKENEESISAMCQELTEGLSALSDDPFSKAPGHPNSHQQHVGPSTSGIGAASSIPQPALQTNPWANTSSGSEAEAWLNQTATAVGAPYAAGRGASPVLNGVSPQPSVTPPLSTGYGAQLSGPQRAPHLGQLRSRTVDVSDVWHQREKAPTLRELSQRKQVTQFQSQQNGNANAGWKASFPTENHPDPFDIAWASKATNKDAPANNPPVNPFDDKTVTKTFEVKL